MVDKDILRSIIDENMAALASLYGHKPSAYFEPAQVIIMDPDAPYKPQTEVSVRLGLDGFPWRTTIWPRKHRKAVLWIRMMRGDYGTLIHNLLEG